MHFIGAKLAYTKFTDDELLWETRDDVNEFFDEIRVVPANENEYGTIKKGKNIDFNPVNLVNEDSVHIVVDTTGAEVDVPTLASFQELKSAFVNLQNKYNDLLVKMKAAGIISSE